MFNAYKIGITVALSNQVSGALGAIAGQFTAAQRKASGLQAQIKGVKKELGMIAALGTASAVAGGFAYAGFKVMNALRKPADEYIHQLGIMRRAGLDNKDLADSVAAAWKTTGTVISTTATENLKSILDLRNTLAEDSKERGGDGKVDMSMALSQLPQIAKLQAVLMASKEGHLGANAGELAFSVAKALDIVGAATNPERFSREMGKMAQVVIATQGRVAPAAYQQVFQYARQGKFDLSDEFKYEILPTMMMEASSSTGAGGGSKGVGPAIAAMYRFTNQGYINQKALPELIKMGLVQGNTAIRTTTSGTTVGAMKGHELAAANPYAWINDVVVPAIKKTYGPNISEQELRFHLNQITRGNQLAASYFVEFATKQANFLRDQKIIKQTMPFEKAFQDAIRSDPTIAYKALGAQWENLKTAFGITAVPIIIEGMGKLTGALNAGAQFFEKHPDAAKRVFEGIAAFTGLMGIASIIWSVAAAFKALRLVFTVGGLIGAVRTGTGIMVTLGGLAVPLAGVAAALIAIAAAAGTIFAIYTAWKNRDAIGLHLKNFALDWKKQVLLAPGNQLPSWLKFGGDGGAPADSYRQSRAAERRGQTDRGAGIRPDYYASLPGAKVAVPMTAAGRQLSTGDTPYQNGSADTAKMFGKLDQAITSLQNATVQLDGQTVGRLILGGTRAGFNGPSSALSGFDGRQGLATP